MERPLAERLIFEDFRSQFSAENGSPSGCRLSYAKNFRFANLPYGLALAKGNDELMEHVNEM